MTVSSTTNKIVYTGNGSTVDFDFTFKIFKDTDLTVTKYTIADGTEEVLTLTTDYTVSIDGDNGGTVTTVATLSSAYKLIIQRVLDLTQEADYVENDPFPAETHEEVADRGVMISQQIKEEVDRSLKVDVAQTGVSLTLPIPEASKLVGWNAAADALENYTPNEEAYITKASQAEAEAGTDNTKFMTSLRTSQSFSQSFSQCKATEAQAQAGTDNATYMTPLRTNQSFIKKQTAVALSIVDGAVATDASLGHVFTLTASEDFTLSNPTNAYNGQKLIWRIKQDATGSRVITLGDKFTVASDIEAVVLSTAADAVDYLGAIYNQAADKFEVVAFAEEQA